MSTKFHKYLWRPSRLVFTIALLLGLCFVVPKAHALPTMTITIDSASVDKLGVVTVNTTLTCSEPFPGVEPTQSGIDVSVKQPYKRIYTIFGQGRASPTQCDGSTQYAIKAIAETGKFASGIVYLDIFAEICDINFNCVTAVTSLNTRIH